MLKQYAAKSNIHRLITTSNWNPLGESWYGNLSKLSFYNRLNKYSHQRILFRKNITSFDSNRTKNLSISANFDSKYIIEHTLWHPDMLRLTGEEFLTSYGFTTVSISKCKVLRFCPECISSGVHLLLHQYHEWEKCVVHGTELSTRCERCKQPVSKYEFPKYNNLPFVCQCCKFRYWDGEKGPSSADIALRVKRLETYEDWIAKIVSMLSERMHGKIKLLSPFNSYYELVYIERFIRGPEWFRNYFFGGNTVRTNSVKINIDFDKPCTGHVTSFADHLPEAIDAFSNPNNIGMGKLFASLKTVFVSERSALLSIYLKHCSSNLSKASIFQHGNTRFWSYFYHDEAHAFDSALKLWLLDLGYFFPEKFNEVIYFHDAGIEDVSGSSLWTEWEDGPGRLLWCENYNMNHWRNVNAVLDISRLWFRMILEEMFKALLVKTHWIECMDHPGYEVGKLKSMLDELKCKPFYVLKKEKCGYRYIQLSKLENRSRFLTLFKSGARVMNTKSLLDSKCLEYLTHLVPLNDEQTAVHSQNRAAYIYQQSFRN